MDYLNYSSIWWFFQNYFHSDLIKIVFSGTSKSRFTVSKSPSGLSEHLSAGNRQWIGSQAKPNQRSWGQHFMAFFVNRPPPKLSITTISSPNTVRDLSPASPQMQTKSPKRNGRLICCGVEGWYYQLDRQWSDLGETTCCCCWCLHFNRFVWDE